MIRLALLLAPAVMAAAQAGAQDTFTGPPQAKRGYDLFFQSTKGQPCGACHAMSGKGTAVGPDLKVISRLPARGFVAAILATRTQYVVSAAPVSGDAFPAMKVKADDKVVELYDLSKTPPELRKLEKAEIKSMTDNSTWKHPPAGAGYTNEELADIIAYIKYAGYKSTSVIKPEDLE